MGYAPFVPGEDVASNAVLPNVWFQAPSELTNGWSGAAWAFDDTGFAWTYMRVGFEQPEDPDLRCTPPTVPFGNALGDDPYTFAVSAVKPYVVYEIKARRWGVAGSDTLSITVRVWVGLQHHFSFFYPGAAAPYSTSDLPPELWDDGSGVVTGRGSLAEWWLALTKATSTAIQWQDPIEGALESFVAYPCDAQEHIAFPTYGDAYVLEENDETPGLPASPLCMSDPERAEDESEEMYSFLGNAIWGEACITMEYTPTRGNSQRELDRAAAERAFIALFGDEVFLEFGVDFFGLPGFYYDQDTSPNEVRRRFCLNASNLRTVTSLAAEMATLRATPEGRWLFRDFDTSQLTVAAAVAAAEGACVC